MLVADRLPVLVSPTPIAPNAIGVGGDPLPMRAPLYQSLRSGVARFLTGTGYRAAPSGMKILVRGNNVLSMFPNLVRTLKSLLVKNYLVRVSARTRPGVLLVSRRQVSATSNTRPLAAETIVST